MYIVCQSVNQFESNRHCNELTKRMKKKKKRIIITTSTFIQRKKQLEENKKENTSKRRKETQTKIKEKIRTLTGQIVVASGASSTTSGRQPSSTRKEKVIQNRNQKM